MNAASDIFDIAIIGGGINGCGIARDAAGRGLSVHLCEQGDLGGATSSASTKLIHGGLRYLEHYDFGLVREALIERERLWSIAPHIVWPLRLILPWRRGLRPAWMLRAGLFLYDHLGGRERLPPTRTLNLGRDAAGAPLRPDGTLAWEFSDCWVQDNRLVVLNARDAARLGAVIAPRTRCVTARREGEVWRVTLETVPAGVRREIAARALVNAAGPWVDIVESDVVGSDMPGDVRLVQGSHVVVPKLFGHDRAYFFQNPDGRIFFAIPYEDDFTLIGTTERDYTGDPGQARVGEDDIAYLCDSASAWFRRPVTPEDVVWSYTGVRPLFDEGGGRAGEATREFRFGLGGPAGVAPFLSVYGGKITTYRRLAEEALAKLEPWFPGLEDKRGWTGGAALPGGGFGIDAIEDTERSIAVRYPFLSAREVRHFFRHYGADAFTVLGTAAAAVDLGTDFGGGLTEAEVQYLRRYEWAATPEDIVWRRTKRGLRMSAGGIGRLEGWMAVNPA